MRSGAVVFARGLPLISCTVKQGVNFSFNFYLSAIGKNEAYDLNFLN